jgi:hypothetical protein
MCYSGKCKYENGMGDCTLYGLNPPEDADCSQPDEPEAEDRIDSDSFQMLEDRDREN